MKLCLLRTASGLSFAVLLAACGAGNPTDMPAQTAAMVQTSVQTSVQPSAQASTGALARASTQVASAAMPAPDCAADGCKGLRIIDANAESFRYDAMHRAATPQS